MDELDFTIEEIIELIYNSVEAAFISQEEKQVLRKIIKEELDKIDKNPNKR